MSINKKYKTIKTLNKKRSVKVVKKQNNEKLLVLKKFKKSINILKYFRKKKEVSVIKELEKIDEVNVPKIVSEEKDCVVYEYVDKVDGYNIEDKELVAENIVALQFANVSLKRNFFEKILDNLWDKPIMMLQREIILKIRILGLKNFLKAQKILINNYNKQKKIKGLNSHGDVNKNNVFIDKKNNFYFCDFESFFQNSKLILFDPLRYSCDLDDITKIDFEFIKKYAGSLKKRSKEVYKKTNFEAQIRLALLKETISMLPHKRGRNAKKFIEQILLNDENYNSWFNKNIKPLLL